MSKRIKMIKRKGISNKIEEEEKEQEGRRETEAEDD